MPEGDRIEFLELNTDELEGSYGDDRTSRT